MAPGHRCVPALESGAVEPMFRLEVDAGEDQSAAAGAEALAASGELPAKEMLAAFRRAVHLEPTDPDYHYILGTALMRLGRHSEAVTALREALSFQPDDTTYRRTLGTALWRHGRFAEAADAYQHVLRTTPRDIEALNGLSLAQFKLGDLRRAEESLSRAHATDRSRADVRSNYAVVLWAAGRREPAERHFQKAVETSPAYVPFRLNHGYALLGLGRPAEAVQRFREALHYAPEDAGVLFDLGDACFAAGNAAEAEEAWDRGALLDPPLAASRTGSRESRRALAQERLREEMAAERVRSSPVGAALAASDHLRESIERWRVWTPRGLGRLALFGVGLLALRALFVVAPHYIANFSLRDDVARAARTASKDDSLVHERVMSAVREHGRDPYVRPESVHVEYNGRLRRIELLYAVPVDLLPGFRRSLSFRIRVEEPVLIAPDTTFL